MTATYLSTVEESKAEEFYTPNILQTAGRVQYICAVMTDRSQKEKIVKESIPISVTK
jgi:hypothetical protein